MQHDKACSLWFERLVHTLCWTGEKMWFVDRPPPSRRRRWSCSADGRVERAVSRPKHFGLASSGAQSQCSTDLQYPRSPGPLTPGPLCCAADRWYFYIRMFLFPLLLHHLMPSAAVLGRRAAPAYVWLSPSRTVWIHPSQSESVRVGALPKAGPGRLRSDRMLRAQWGSPIARTETLRGSESVVHPHPLPLSPSSCS